MTRKPSRGTSSTLDYRSAVAAGTLVFVLLFYAAMFLFVLTAFILQ